MRTEAFTASRSTVCALGILMALSLAPRRSYAETDGNLSSLMSYAMQSEELEVTHAHFDAVDDVDSDGFSEDGQDDGFPDDGQDNTTTVISGVWGSCPWEIDANGALTIHPGRGENADAYGLEESPWHEYANSIFSIVMVEDDGQKVMLPENCNNLFRGLTEVAHGDLSRSDSSGVKSMRNLFAGCISLEDLDVSGWDMSGIVDTTAMFSECYMLSSVTIGEQYVMVSVEDFPLPCYLEDMRWQSVRDGGVFTRDEIVNTRSGIADTYHAIRVFPDVAAGTWYFNVVGRAADIGLINGYDNGYFGPNDNITRGQVAVILWRMAGQPKPGPRYRTFYDVSDSAYYYEAVKWASSVGVVNGYADGGFGPGDHVTREQLAVMLSNYAGRVEKMDAHGFSTDYAGMKDADKVASYARSAVGWCFRNKILSGSNGNVLPQGYATRAQAAKMLVRLYDLAYPE